MKTRILFAVVVLALIAGVVYRTQFGADAGRKDGGGPIAVKTVPVQVRDFPRVIELPGVLEAAQQVAIVAQVGGTLLRQHVQEGDTVRAGQVLFTLDARPAQTRIAQYQAELAGARAEMSEAQKKLDRLQPLLQSGYISRQEYDDAVLALEAARARAGTAGAGLEAARLDVHYAQISAPIAGKVGRIAVRPGGLVQAGGDALTYLIAPGTLEARAWLAESDWPRVAAARSGGRVEADIFPDTRAHAERPSAVARGELVFVDAQIDPATGAVPIKVRLASQPAGLLSGQGVRVRLMLGNEPQAKVLPEPALQHGQGGTYVYVVRNGAATVQAVRVTHSLDGEMAVEGELQPGEPVLIEVPKRLKAGGKVRLEGDKPQAGPDKARP